MFNFLDLLKINIHLFENICRIHKLHSHEQARRMCICYNHIYNFIL